MGHSILALPLLVVACVSAPLAAQPCGVPAWREVTPVPPAYANLVYDSWSRQIVAFGTGSLNGLMTVWQWDGHSWQPLVAPGPPPLLLPMMAFDSVRGETVLFGGACYWGNAPPCPDEYYSPKTWVFDGQAWQERASSGPEGRILGAMAELPTAGQVVLFGGGPQYSSDDEPLAGTWIWDGATWTKHKGTEPEPRYGHKMAYDPVTDRILLFGGRANRQYLDDTWAWDGTQWAQLDENGPSARHNFAMATDLVRNRVVLHAGYDGDWLTDTWAWDGESWSQIATDGPRGWAIAFDAHSQGILVREDSVQGGEWRNWSLTDSDWNLRHVDRYPTPREAVEVVYRTATGESVFVGGREGYWGEEWVTETWVAAGPTWQLMDHSTPEFYYGAFAYDSLLDRVICYSPNTQRLWEWTKTEWAELEVPPFTEKHYGLGLAYDAGRGELVFFGGGEWRFTDVQWMQNGETWREFAGQRPSARRGHTMVYDAARDRVVLFGGEGITGDDRQGYLGDTWEWDGSQWHHLDTPGPPPRADMAMCYDPVRERVLLSGGTYWCDDFSCLIGFADCWAWDGIEWTLLTEGDTPIAYEPGMVFDTRLGGAVRISRTIETWGAPKLYQFVEPISPDIIAQPESIDRIEGAFASLFVDADGHSALTYTWRKNTIPLTDDARIVGSRKRTLSIDPVRLDDAGDYDVIITNDCGMITSQSATLTVNARCPGDFDADGDADPSDVAAFLDAWRADSPDADFNADGMIDTRDVIAFLTVWAAGCP